MSLQKAWVKQTIVLKNPQSKINPTDAVHLAYGY